MHRRTRISLLSLLLTLFATLGAAQTETALENTVEGIVLVSSIILAILALFTAFHYSGGIGTSLRWIAVAILLYVTIGEGLEAVSEFTTIAVPESATPIAHLLGVIAAIYGFYLLYRETPKFEKVFGQHGGEE